MSNPQTIDIFSVNPAWEQVRLRYVVHLNPGKSEVGHVSEDTSVSFIPMEEVEEDGTFNGPEEKLLGEVYSGYTYFRDGDVLVAKITPCFENGKGALVDGLTNGLGFGSTEFHVLRADQQIEPRFLFYLTRTHPFRDVGAAMMTGAAGQKRVPDDFLANLMIPCPSRPVQRSVANFLDEKTSQIDELIAKKERLIELLEEKRSALINRAVTKGLDPDVPMKDSGVPWIGEIPEHWDVRRLKFAVAQIIDCKNRTPDYFPQGAYGVARTTNVRDGAFRTDELRFTDKANYREWTKRGVPRPGDLLFTREAPAGEACKVPDQPPICLGQRMMLIRPNPEIATGDFLLLAVYGGAVEGFIKTVSAGSTVSHVRVEEVGNLPIFLPPIEEQQRITERAGQELVDIADIMGQMNWQLEILEEYRQSLITAAVTGQIDVTEESTDISEEELAGTVA